MAAVTTPNPPSADAVFSAGTEHRQLGVAMNDLITETNGTSRLCGHWTADEDGRPVLHWYLEVDCPTATADVELAA